LGALLFAQPDAVHYSGQNREALLDELRENVRQHDAFAKSLVPLFAAGMTSVDEMCEAEVRVAEARALEARVTGDLEPQREAQLQRIALYERRLADGQLRADETSPEARLRLLHDLAEARVRLWELDHPAGSD
jgi:hypothetical protein